MNYNKRILITGGSGFIGSTLKTYLQNQGYDVAVMTRNPNPKSEYAFYWDPATNEFDHRAFDFAQNIIHLAGENIAGKRWTPQRKKAILESRTQASECLAYHLRSSGFKPEKIIAASAIGYYGQHTRQQIFTEESLPGNDFVGRTVKDWEKAQQIFNELQVPVTRIRIGIVLSTKGGALPKMLLPVKFGLGSGIGSGKQYMPWISLRDLHHVFHFVLDNDYPGEVFNAVAPQHIQNRAFNSTVAKALGKPFFLPNVPAFLLKLIFGEMSVLLLEGSRVSADKLIRAGFVFEDTDLYRTMVKEFSGEMV